MVDTHLKNVSMRQSNGPKATMPSARPTGELLLALNEFNKYELYTGTGEGVQPLFSDGTGTSNVSFSIDQANASELAGKFVYFDNATGTWKAAYAQAAPNQGEHYTAQGFAVSLSSTGLQVTTSGKLIIPFALTDYTGKTVVAGSYYYLCQEQANAGLIQQSAPTSGIMQIVCQVIAIDDKSTTLLLLNDLSQVADDVIVTDGDGSKYLGDDGQYHPMMVAGLAGRTANCIGEYELLDTKFENIAAGRTSAIAYTFPSLTANGTYKGSAGSEAIGFSYTNTSGAVVYQEVNSNYIAQGKDWGSSSGITKPSAIDTTKPVHLVWQFKQKSFWTSLYSKNNTVAANASSNWETFTVAYSDDGDTWIDTGYMIVNPVNTASAEYSFNIPAEQYRTWGAHLYWSARDITSFAGTNTLYFNTVRPSGEYFNVSNVDSKGYVKVGAIAINNNIASGFNKESYLLSKYQVEGYSQYSFRIRQKFTQVEDQEIICTFANQHNYLAVENGTLKFILNDHRYVGNATYEANKFYHFRLTYDINTGYALSMSEDGNSWTNEIILSDEVNYLNNLSIYLGFQSAKEQPLFTSGEIDLANTGFDFINGSGVAYNYPISNTTDKDIATITMTFKGNGLIAAGRSNQTNTLLAIDEKVDTKNNTIVGSEATDLLWDAQNGMVTGNYSEVNYASEIEDIEENSYIYAKDTNLVYKYTVVYPNFIENNIKIEKDTAKYIANVDIVGDESLFNAETGLLSGFSTSNYAVYPYIFNPGSKPWRRRWKITTGALSSIARITGSYTVSNCGLELQVHTDGIFKMALSSTGTSWDIASWAAGTYKVQANTAYLVEVEFTGTQYLLKYSANNGASFTTDITVASSVPIYASQDALGVDLSTANGEIWLGSIDLTGCSDYIDGKLVWSGLKENASFGDAKIDFSNSNASFHPDKFLSRNGFNFSLKLDITGAVKLTRMYDARNYGGSYAPYYQVQGVDWSTFVNDGNYNQGIKFSNYLGTSQLGTANGSLYQLSVLDNNYAETVTAAQNTAGPGFLYFNFINPVRFSTIAFRNYSDGNYIPQQYCMHVSNDLNNWYSIMPKTAAGYIENGMFNNLPMDAQADWPNKTTSALFITKCEMPDEHTYWKYVRLGFYRNASYRPLVCGCWIGSYANSTTVANWNSTNAEELLWEDKNFINTGTSGINASIVRKKTGTAYQVRFLDQLGYVSEAPEQGVIDVDGKQLAPNNTKVYKDARLAIELAEQRLAYQTNCPVYLREDITNGLQAASNPFMDINSGWHYSGCANVGTVTNSFNLLSDTTTTYDFANATNENAFIITFLNRCFVNRFLLRNHTSTGYSANSIKIYGSVDGGTTEGTVAVTAASNPVSYEAKWEEIPVISITPTYNSLFDLYKPTEEPLTYCTTAHDINPLSGTSGSGDYGSNYIYIKPERAYLQYKVVLQRTVNNRVIEMQIIPQDVWLDPFATQVDNNGNNIPLLPSRSYYPSSSLTVLPSKETRLDMMYTSPYSPTTMWQVYQAGNNANWDPKDSREFIYAQSVYKYPIDLSYLVIGSGTDLGYKADSFELYGTNNTDKATTALSNTNSLNDWIRTTNLRSKSDIPTILSVADRNSSLNLGSKDYGYNYFTYLFARRAANRVLIDTLQTQIPTAATYLTDIDALKSYSKYTEEWKWTNVPGEKDEVRNAACYNHPLLETGETTSLKPVYEVKRKPIFDKSKFTVVGSPMITDDGVASKFSTTDYLKIPYTLGNTYSAFSLKFKFRTAATRVGPYIIGGASGYNFLIAWANAGYFSIYLSSDNSTWNIASAVTGKTKVVPNTDYWMNVVFDGEKYVVYVSTNDRDYNADITITSSVKANIIDLSLGYAWSQVANYAYDLAQISLTVNGKEVFSGSKPTTYYTSIAGEKDAALSDGTKAYRTTSLVDYGTTPYESRWMYGFTDDSGNSYYSNATPVGNAPASGSYLYKKIIPQYNTEYYTGIPLTATANSGSTNGYTYFASSENSASTAAWVAFQNDVYDAETWASKTVFTAATGVPSEEQYLGFRAPSPICVQGYTLGTRVSNASNPAIWDFQGSNDGQTWETLDSRNTTSSGAEGAKDAPICSGAGTAYYFNNEKSFQYYRWLIKQDVPGMQTYTRLKVKTLFVLEENPALVQNTFELTRINSIGETEYAYTNVSGAQGDSIANNATIYSDKLLQVPEENIWAYEVNDGTHTYWTSVPGNTGAYAPEQTMIYKDFDFDTEFEAAKVDTWQYTGNINKKFAYSGLQVGSLTYDGEEPYNKYFYTGKVVNQFKYTGKIEGWTYTGVTEDIYDIVPNIHVSLNRDDARTITKRTSLGMAYPVTDATGSTTYYSFTSSDIAGSIVPNGTPLYNSIDAAEPTVTADGTNNYVYSSAPAQNRYTYDYLYVTNNDLPDMTMLTGTEQAYYDADLTKQVNNAQVDLSQYYYDSTRTASHLHDFYHRIEEHTPSNTHDYTVGLGFDGSKYTFTAHSEGGAADLQTFDSGELIKSSYTGSDEQTRDKAVIIMRQQDYAKLNLSDSTYSWWDWNNLLEKTNQQSVAQVFRLAKVEGSRERVDAIYNMYPWRVGEGSSSTGIKTYDSIKKKFVDVAEAVIVPNSVLDESNEIELPKNAAVLYGIPNFYWGYSYYSSTSFTGSKTFTNGGIIYAQTAQTVTVQQSGLTAMSFTNFVGVLPIPPKCTVNASGTVLFNEN